MGRVLTRSELGRVTRCLRTYYHHDHHHHHHDHSAYRMIPFSTITTKIRPFPSKESQLPEGVVRLKCKSSAKSGSCKVYLVGTHHDSPRSCEEVRTVIKLLKPEVVFLELCSKRQIRLSIQPPVPNCQFRAAYEEVKKYGGKAGLGDRPVEITEMRARRKMPLLEKIKKLSSTFRKDCLYELQMLSEETTVDMVNLRMEKVAKMYPTFMESIIHERDLYMSHTLLQVAKRSSCVVAVVGITHLQGIKKHWQQPVSVEELLIVPPPKNTAKILTSVGVVGGVMTGVAMIWRYL